jgi:hypothetical protein
MTLDGRPSTCLGVKVSPRLAASVEIDGVPAETVTVPAVDPAARVRSVRTATPVVLTFENPACSTVMS